MGLGQMLLRSRFGSWRAIGGGLAATAVLLLCSSPASAHLGRRLRLNIENGKIVAYGANTGEPDGMPNERPYAGAVHDHWKNYTLPSLPQPVFAQTFLPEFDVPASVTGLVGRSLTLDLVAAWQWANPMMSHHGHTTPTLTPLDPGEVIRVDGALNTWTDTVQKGSLLLSEPLPAGGDPDVPILYSIVGHPVNEIHVLKFVISASTPAGALPLLPSAPVFVMISPDGTTMAEKLHHESLLLEEFMSNVPEPSGGCLMLLATSALVRRPRRFGLAA